MAIVEQYCIAEQYIFISGNLVVGYSLIKNVIRIALRWLCGNISLFLFAKTILNSDARHNRPSMLDFFHTCKRNSIRIEAYD